VDYFIACSEGLIMKVEVHLYASFTKYLPEDAEGQKIWMNMAEGATTKQVLSKLGVPLDHVKMIFLNNVKVDEDTVLKNGDRMGAFPPVAGG